MVWPWERKALATWETTETDEIGSTTWTVHFPTMRMVVEFYWLVDGHDDDECVPVESVLRRTDRGWHAKLTDASYQNQLKTLRTEAAGGGLFADDLQKRFEALREKGNQWQPIADDFFAGLEPAYQRYVHQG